MSIAPWNDPTVRWVCEDHPTEEQGHHVKAWTGFRSCGGAGMPDPKTHDNMGRPLITLPEKKKGGRKPVSPLLNSGDVTSVVKRVDSAV